MLKIILVFILRFMILVCVFWVLQLCLEVSYQFEGEKIKKKLGLEQVFNCCCSSVSKSGPTLYNAVDCRTASLSVPHHLPEFAQVHVHRVGDAIQPSRPL